MGNKHITSRELKKMNGSDIHEFTTPKYSQDFWHYAPAQKIDLILKSQTMRAGRLDAMNDLHENSKSSNGHQVFSICFCNTNSEKIPLWYLYSGIFGDGMRMGLTPSKMRDLIKSISIVNGVKENRKISLGVGETKEVSIQFGFVFYKKTDGIINYKRVWYEVDDYSQGEFEKDNHFIKDYPWEYEKEFRIVFINNTNDTYDYLEIDISDEIYKSLKLGFGPEVADNPKILESDGFRKYAASHIGKSTLGIKMGLARNSRESIIERIGDIIEYDQDKKERNIACVCESMCKKKKCVSAEQCEKNKERQKNPD